MDYTSIFKALSNDTRLQILLWLKEPDLYFPSKCLMDQEEDFVGGVCVGTIQEKTGLSQSTTSQYLSMLQRTGLLEAKRIGQWTYYRRNENTIQQLTKWMNQEF